MSKSKHNPKRSAKATAKVKATAERKPRCNCMFIDVGGPFVYTERKNFKPNRTYACHTGCGQIIGPNTVKHAMSNVRATSRSAGSAKS